MSTHCPCLPSERAGQSLERLGWLVQVEDLDLPLRRRDDHERVDHVESCGGIMLSA